MAREEQKSNEQQNTAGSQQMQTQSTGRGDRWSRQSGLTRGGQFGASPFGSSPFAFMRRFSEQMDRLFDDFGFGGSRLGSSFGREFFPANFEDVGQSLWSPQIETFERSGQLVIRADLPGLKKDDVNVEITGDAITISGERRSEDEERREGYYRSERSYGSFFRTIPLPEGVNADDAKATFENGVLEITMQAPQLKSRGRRLEITEGTAGNEQSRGKAAGR